MPSQPDLSLVVPAYAEATVIVPTLRALAEHLSARPARSVEVVVVVADAADATLELARGCVPWFEQCQVIDAGRRAGKGRDVRLGMLAARGRFRMFMDADLATPLHHLDELDAHMAANAAVVVGVRHLWRTHTRLRRRLIATGGNLLIRTLLLPGVSDTQCGFKMFRADVSEAVFSNSTVDGWGFDLEVLAAARRLGHNIDTLLIDDWRDPKSNAAGLGGDGVGRAATEVLHDLLRIRIGLWFEQTPMSSPRPRSSEPMPSAAQRRASSAASSRLPLP
jgi:dolichyl-phosphate beta-glucosyltransferase